MPAHSVGLEGEVLENVMPIRMERRSAMRLWHVRRLFDAAVLLKDLVVVDEEGDAATRLRDS